jgi:uncharacterized membrane protein
MIHPILALSLSLFLAVILLSAASHKLRARDRFARQLADYALLPESTIGWVARLLPALEVLVGVALLVPALRTVGAIAAALMLVLYSAAIAINLLRGRRDIDCGCSGPGLERPLGAPLIVRNAVLLGMAALVALPASHAALHGFGLFLIAACVATGLMLYTATEGLLANQPRLDSLSRR